MTLHTGLVHSRGTTASYIDSSGILQYTTGLRTQHASGVATGVLVEGAATNVAVTTETFATTWLVASPGSPTKSSVAITNPAGGGNSVKFQRSSTSSSFMRYLYSKAASRQYWTFSIFVKKGVGDYVALRVQGQYPGLAEIVVNINNGTLFTSREISGPSGTMNLVGYTIEPLGDSWYRLSVSAYTDAFSSVQAVFSCSSNGAWCDTVDSITNSSCYMWGGNIVNQGYISSYIQHNGTTGTVTRNADVLYLDSVIEQGPGSLVITYSTDNPNSRTLASVGNSTSDRLTVLDPTTSSKEMSIYESNVLTNSVTGSSSEKSIGVTWSTNKLTIVDSDSEFVTTGSITLPTLDRLFIGTRSTSGSELNGVISRLLYWPEQMSAQQLRGYL